MTAATMINPSLILPAEGYDAFVDFLFNVPSQPELIARRKKRKNQARSPTGSSVSSAASVTWAMDDEWDTNYRALKSFHAKNGHCTVPFGRETGALRSWTERQKKLHKSSQLEPSQVGDLKALDFDFTVRSIPTRSVASSRSGDKSANASIVKPVPSTKKQKTKPSSPTNAAKPAPSVRKSSLIIDDDETWNKQYEALEAYHAKHGNCTVPFGKETGALRSWTERQRKVHASSMLKAERVEKLTELDFF